jgi:hypothetical protein
MYGLVMRSSIDFIQPSTYIYLYKSLIRSQLDYAVSVWNPFYRKYADALESVQKRFLKVMHYRCFHKHLTYDQLLVKYDLLNLKSRRLHLEAMFLYDLCHNRYDCIELINKLFYRVPYRAHCRNPGNLFAISFCRTNSGKRSPMYRITNSYNDNFNSIDMYGTNVSSFKHQIVKALKSS